MSSRTLTMTDALSSYLQQTGLRESAPAARLRAETAKLPWAMMQISPEQGALMQMLVRLIGATRTLEVGTFTGYSALVVAEALPTHGRVVACDVSEEWTSIGRPFWREAGVADRIDLRLKPAVETLEVGTFTGYSALVVAEALPPHGRVVACDVSEEWTSIGRPFWREAGVADRIDLRLKPAVETLDELIAAGQSGGFDFAFIDADKSNYDAYYERALVLLRPGGLVGVDNTLWSGAVVDPARDDADTRAIRAVNEKIRHDRRVEMVLVPIGDGLTLARKH